jgi:energy-converting hydrogenase Eha subunit F
MVIEPRLEVKKLNLPCFFNYNPENLLPSPMPEKKITQKERVTRTKRDKDATPCR